MVANGCRSEGRAKLKIGEELQLAGFALCVARAKEISSAVLSPILRADEIFHTCFSRLDSRFERRFDRRFDSLVFSISMVIS
jgi:hypothetical protein